MVEGPAAVKDSFSFQDGQETEGDEEVRSQEGRYMFLGHALSDLPLMTRTHLVSLSHL